MTIEDIKKVGANNSFDYMNSSQKTVQKEKKFIEEVSENKDSEINSLEKAHEQLNEKLKGL